MPPAALACERETKRPGALISRLIKLCLDELMSSGRKLKEPRCGKVHLSDVSSTIGKSTGSLHNHSMCCRMAESKWRLNQIYKIRVMCDFKKGPLHQVRLTVCCILFALVLKKPKYLTGCRAIFVFVCFLLLWSF